LRKNLPIYQNGKVTACSGARAILRFFDGSVLKTGADDEVVLDDYVYDRRGGTLSDFSRVPSGSLPAAWGAMA
jgi:hypothetical protein